MAHIIKRIHLRPALIGCGLALGVITQAQAFNVEEATIAQVQRAIKAGNTSCVDIVQAYLDRIHKYEFRLNSITYLNPNALSDAAQLDKKLSAGQPLGPLFCIPVLLKDNLNTVDMPTTNGSAVLKGAIPNSDAFVTSKIRRADAIILGKADMGEFAKSDYNTIDGVVTNPYSRLRTTSGSSAGSAAALTANLTLLAVGTDTSQSIRAPAGYTSVVGLRPTTGFWSRSGIAPKNFLYDEAGPMARTVTDTAVLLGVAAGLDNSDPMNVAVYKSYPAADGVKAGSIDYTQYLKRDALKGKRIGVVRDFFGRDAETNALAERAIGVMRSLGAEIVEIKIDPKFLDFYVTNGHKNLRLPADFEFKRDFEKYLSTYFGQGVPKTVAEFVEIYRTRIAASEKPVESGIMALLTTSLKTSPDDPVWAHLVDTLLPAATDYKNSLFADNKVDALVYPTSADFAPPIDDPVLKTTDPTYVAPGVSSFIFAPYSSIGNPAITVPMGAGAQKLPAGITFMGRPYAEGTILGFAYAYEQASHLRVPPDLSKL